VKRFAIIVAGGSGQRMGGDLPKQFMLLNGKPILFHTLSAFQKAIPDINLILVLPQNEIETWTQLCKSYQMVFSTQIVAGGNTRFQSVDNGLKLVPNEEGVLIAIHDGVRPLVSATLIQKCFSAVTLDIGVVPITKLKESIVNANNLQMVDRENLRSVQTPQIFPAKKLKDAYEFCSILDPLGNGFTDDSSVFSKSGYKINSVAGEYSNIKITTADDIIIASALLDSIQ